MISTTTNQRDKWYGRVIVPMYNRSNQVIFYQGRSFTGSNKRWESPAVPKANVVFGYHNLDNQDKQYVIVCEGPFDAMSVDGIALLGSELTPYHKKVLNQVSRK
jgi:DNA primase